jgi:hypothetical protein
MKKIILAIATLLTIVSVPSLLAQTPQGQITQIVTVTTTTLQMASSQNPSTIGQPVTFLVTIQAIGGIIPTGTVTISSSTGLVIGTATLAPQTGGGYANASITYTFTAGGSYVLTPSYSGDNNYSSINKAALNLNKTKMKVSSDSVTYSYKTKSHGELIKQ